MYSRYEKPGKDLRIPAQYSGCAFVEKKPQTEAYLPPRRPLPPPVRAKIPKVDPPPVAPPPPPPPPIPLPPPPDKEEKHLNSLPHGLSALVGGGFPFGHGIGFEELLIMGLILLISQGENASDTVFWLTLLLLCG